MNYEDVFNQFNELLKQGSESSILYVLQATGHLVAQANESAPAKNFESLLAFRKLANSVAGPKIKE